MKNKIQIFIASLFIFGIGVFTSNTKAQVKNSNLIQEIKLNKNDAFTDIRKELLNNFDFTNYEYKHGVVNSEVKFNITESGKIVNVHSTGDCKNVSKEIENVLTNLKVKQKKLNQDQNTIAYTYVMPVTVQIDNR